MRCPQGATVTRTSPVPAKLQPLPEGAAPDTGPVAPRTYRIDDERTEVQEKKVNGKRIKSTVKIARCKGTIAKVTRLDDATLGGTCSKCGPVTMNAAIWSKEAGL